MTKPNYTSWIDGIRYSEKSKILVVIIRGVEYAYLNVSRRTRDKVRWAGQRNGWTWGEAYNRLIKGQYTCIKLSAAV